jgi:hypothetical protein
MQAAGFNGNAVLVIGAGLAGTEAAWGIARAGEPGEAATQQLPDTRQQQRRPNTSRETDADRTSRQALVNHKMGFHPKANISTCGQSQLQTAFNKASPYQLQAKH